MHIAFSNIPGGKGNNRKARESARIWVARQYQKDEIAANKKYVDRIEAIRKHYPDFK